MVLFTSALGSLHVNRQNRHISNFLSVLSGNSLKITDKADKFSKICLSCLFISLKTGQNQHFRQDLQTKLVFYFYFVCFVPFISDGSPYLCFTKRKNDGNPSCGSSAIFPCLQREGLGINGYFPLMPSPLLFYNRNSIKGLMASLST